MSGTLVKAILVAMTVLCLWEEPAMTAPPVKDEPRGFALILAGSEAAGYSVDLSYEGNVIARDRRSGAVSLTFENTIHNLRESFPDWKPQKGRILDTGRVVELSGAIRTEHIGLRADVRIRYEVVNPHVVRKTIRLGHRYGPRVFYSLTNALAAAEKPARFWSFAVPDHDRGGIIREPFPAMGFQTTDGLTVGLLTDNGFRNRWTRANTMFHADTSKGLTTIKRVPDEAFTYIVDDDERHQGDDYVAFNFGQYHLNDLEKDGQAVVEAYHPLLPGQEDERILFIFAEPAASHRETMIACQTRLAEGQGFTGTQAEKILWADVQMLTWINEPASLMAYPSPSIGYQFFYQRDAFWMVAAMLDRDIAEQTWELVRYTQDETGGVCCHYIPYRWHKGIPGGQTDANIHWIIWAYINQQRYGSKPDANALARNLDWIRRNFCIGEAGEYWTRSAGWFDVFHLQEPVRISHMQGEFAVALRCARALGLDVTDEEIAAAGVHYRNCYIPDRKYMPFGLTEDFERLLSPTVLMPEFLSLWLFDEAMLSDEMVSNTLDALDRAWNKRRAGGYALPNIITDDGEFQTKEEKIFAPSLWWEPGIYHNGGSWLLYEYLAYVAGHRHGWTPKYVGASALERMEKRLELEFSEELQPVSHEFIPLTKAIDTPGSVWDGSSDAGVPGPPGSKVFGWNAFVIIANEVAGIRPPQDPIVVKHVKKR